MSAGTMISKSGRPFYLTLTGQREGEGKNASLDQSYLRVIGFSFRQRGRKIGRGSRSEGSDAREVKAGYSLRQGWMMQVAYLKVIKGLGEVLTQGRWRINITPSSINDAHASRKWLGEMYRWGKGSVGFIPAQGRIRPGWCSWGSHESPWESSTVCSSVTL